MRTVEQMLRLKKSFPDLSADAFLLLVLIIHRMEGTKLADENGEKFIYLTGMNDPRILFGWCESKFERTKRELRENGLIRSRRGDRAGKPSLFYLGSELSKMTGQKRQVKSDRIVLSEVTGKSCQIRQDSSVRSDSTLSIEKDKSKRDKGKGIKKRDAAFADLDPDPDPDDGPFTKILKEMLAEEEANGEK